MKRILFIFLIFPHICSAQMNKTACAALVTAKIKAVNGDSDIARLTPFWEAICEGVIEHLKNSAIINTTGTATVSSGSSAGAHPTVSVGTIQ